MTIIDDLEAAGIEAAEFDTVRGRLESANDGGLGLIAPGYWSDAFAALARLAIGYKGELDAVREALGGPDCPCTVENITARMREAEACGAECEAQYQERRLYSAEKERDLAHDHILQLETERDAARAERDRARDTAAGLFEVSP